MATMRRQTCIGAIVVAMGVSAALPVQGAGSRRAALAASQKEIAEAERLHAEVVRLYEQGRYNEALPLAERALAIREKALGPEQPDVATSLNKLGELYWLKGEYMRAEPLFQRALAIQEKALGPEHPDVANTLNNLAALYTAKVEYVRAEPLYQRALAIREKALGPEHPDVAESLNNLAWLHQRNREYMRAEPLYQRALAIFRKALGPEHIAVSGTLNNLALLYQAKGEYTRAEPLFQRALIIKKALGPEHPDVAITLNNLAVLLWDKGEYARAEPLYQRALVIREKVLGPEHPEVATTLNNLAALLWNKGEYARAEPLHQRALAIREKALGPDHPEVATTLNNLATLYRDKGEYARAEPLYQRALAIQEKAVGPEHPDVAFTLNNLATLYREKGEYERAEPLYQRALAIREKALGPEHANVANALNNLGTLYREKGEYERAEPLYQRALAIWQKALGPEHARVAGALHNLAGLYRSKEDYQRAEPLCQRALAIREKALGSEHMDVASSLRLLAEVSAAQGRIPEALRAARRAADILDRNAAAVLAAGSEEQKRLYMATLDDETHSSLSLHLQSAPLDPAAVRFALTVVLRRKGRVLDTMTDSLATLRRTAAPADQTILDQLASVYSQLATQLTRGPGKIPAEQYRANLAALQQEREKLEAELGQRSASFRAQQQPLTLAEMQAALPEGAALLEITRYLPNRLRPRSKAERQRDLRYAAYVLHRHGEPTFVDLGAATPIDAAVDKLRHALADHDRAHDPKPAAHALDALVMQPIRKLLADTRWVFVSPDGPLHLVPFGALVDEQGHYLVERYLFTYLTSGRELLRFEDKRVASRSPPLVLAAPAFDDAIASPLPEATHRGLRSVDMVTQPLPPLESTAEEARTIARLFPDAHVLLGAQATEGALKAVHAPRVLHLATHGFFLPEQPLPEVLLRGSGGEPTPEERAALIQRENPLLRSGVALAGFNRRQSGNDDGVLTALEASGLDLVGTRLVVLSTCESGLGEAMPGEGVQGLRRALAMAGAETQVMSLWQVDTGRTRELMKAYYQKLHAGAGRSEAMREVQLAMLAHPETAHPNLWASFVVSGDWRTLEGAARLPDIGQVRPGPRGCACGQAGGDGSGP